MSSSCSASTSSSRSQEMILLFPVVLDTLLVHGFSVVRVCGKSPWPHTCPWSLFSALSHPLTYTHWHMWGNRVGSRRIFTQRPDKSLIKSWLCSPNSLVLFESKTANIPVYLAWVDIQLTRPASHRGHLSIACFKCTCLITCYLQLQPKQQTNSDYLEGFQ